MKSRPERIEVIKTRADAILKKGGAFTHKIKYRNTANALPVIKLETEYLGYRLENSRTIRQQKGYLRENTSIPKDFFDDPESAHAQQVQEEILYKMVENHKEFLNDLKKYGQDEPAIITYDGFLVNGNRRTAALKKLGVEYVDCAVLPEDISAKEIYQIEQNLQIAEDFRQDYDWINELLNIRAGKEDIKYKLTEKQLAKSLRISTRDLLSKLNRIELVDSFLIWKAIPDHYEYVKLDDAEQIFKELEKGMKKYATDIEKQKSLKDYIFSLIESRPRKGRLYDHVREVIRDFDDILAKIAPDLDPEEGNPNTGKEASIEDIIEGSRNQGEGVDTGSEVSHGKEESNPEIEGSKEQKKNILIIDPEESEETAKKLIEIKEDVKAEKKEMKDHETVYSSVSDALRNLSGVHVNDDSSKLVEAKKKLEELLIIAEALLTEIDNKL